MQDKLGCQKMIKSTLSLLTKLQNYKTKKYYSFCLHSSLSSKNASSLPLFLTKLHKRHFATPHQVPKNIDHKVLFHLKTLKKNEPTPMSFLKPQHCHAYNGQWQLQGRTQCCCVHKKAKIASMKDMMLLCVQEDTNCFKGEHKVKLKRTLILVQIQVSYFFSFVGVYLVFFNLYHI